jgi:hypothetical protein
MRCLLAALVVVAACTDDPPPGGKTQVAVGGCDGLLTLEHNAGAIHVDTGTDITWTNNPPTSGSHFPTWSAWDHQYTQLPRGYYVHNLEHGGIVMLYRCDAGCPEVVDQLLAAARNMAMDPSCASPITKRVIVTADPLLPDDGQVAAVAWNHAYTASCYDPYVETFARDNYGKAPEDFCSDGPNIGGGTPINP